MTTQARSPQALSVRVLLLLQSCLSLAQGEYNRTELLKCSETVLVKKRMHVQKNRRIQKYTIHNVSRVLKFSVLSTKC